MKLQNVWFTSFLAIVLFSCSPQLTPFSEKLYNENKWSDDDLKKIQFYLSEDIVLRRKVDEGQTSIENGKIRTINGEKIEEIIFKRGTPGVFLFSPKEERFAVSFESGVNQKFLMFGANPKLSNRYALMGKEWSRNSGIVTYDEVPYYTSSESAYSCLLVDLKRAKNSIRKSYEVKGHKVE
ncbi:MAG: hypothetical protein M3Q56_04535 [Bacteroidota bacterium]|nr:hypothetical protein [Bacteroidota bacterium]